MAFRRLYDLPQGFQQPAGMGTAPPAFNPMGGTTTYGGGMSQQYAAPVQGGRIPSISPNRPGIVGPPTQPTPPSQGVPGSFAPGQPTPKPAPATELEVSPFMNSLYESIRNVDPDQRESYLQSLSGQIKGRLDRYEFRLARGLSLSADQQTRYQSLKDSFNDIAKYVGNPDVYDKYFGNIVAQSPVPSAATSNVRTRLPGQVGMF